MPQHYCAFCDAPLAKPTGPANTGARRLERLIDDLLRLETAGRAPDDRKSLAARLARYQVPVGPATSTMPYLSHRVRHDFFRRLSERQIKARDPTERGPLTFWLGLARAAESHNGLVNALTGQLAETAGLQRATLTRMANLADLLEAKSRLSRKQQETPLQSVRED